LDREIDEAGALLLEQGEKALTQSIQRLEELLHRPELTSTQRLNLKMHLAQAHQYRGEHKAAINLLESTALETGSKPGCTTTPYLESLRATSLCALGELDEACAVFEHVLDELGRADAGPKERALVSLEAGKAFKSNGNTQRAKECWQYALTVLEKEPEEIIHFARVKANLGLILLDSCNQSEQEEGVRAIEHSSDVKLRLGDLEGLANNSCNLGLYYWKNKRYQRAITCLRRDLFLSRKVGNLRSVATSLMNLAGLYTELRQFTPARNLLREGQDIGFALDDARLVKIADHNLDRVEKAGRDAGGKGERVGPAANCACGSGTEYQHCCGRADFEPIEFGFQFEGVSEDLNHIIEAARRKGVEPSRLDFILRDTPQSSVRQAWSRLHVHDGWMEMSELPDMANCHLSTARTLAGEAKSEPDNVAKPLACVILSACALEAFVN